MAATRKTKPFAVYLLFLKTGRLKTWRKQPKQKHSCACAQTSDTSIRPTSKADKGRRTTAVGRILESDIWPARPKPYNPRLLQNQISAAPVQAGAQCKAALCLSRTFPRIINYL